ncbi:GTPase IMAP family member 8-like [Sphaeramia orbicularis]|uniref:GTPase IMAP family member 8-like n=1 Tax=Sphaeramia orbicularis TaxID=375764 RepID=UPI00117D9D98|nr:GTPase IMAP family member 8-like [Sphaeramia orbicularis]
MACQHKEPSYHLPELRIVLIGGKSIRGELSHKSATGNAILGKKVFETKRRTAQSEVNQQDVHGRRVTVVDTPAWWWHYPLENTSKLDQIEIKNSVHLCPPGPHAFLLVIPVGLIFCDIFKPSLEEHLKLFDKGVFDHTIVLFSTDAPCSDQSLQYEINTWPALRWILQQCGNRKHVFNISNSQDRSQVIALFEKIEAMNAKNAGNFYSTDAVTGKAVKDQLEAISEKAAKRFAEVQYQRRKLRASIDGGKTPPAHLRLVMVGAQWSAKSSAGNIILKKDAFSVYHRRTTEYCEIGHSVVAHRHLTVVDSPGWFYNHTLQDTCEMDKSEIKRSMYLCPPGPHAILLVVGLSSAFNASYQRAVQEHMSMFSEEVWNHTIVLFTRGDWLGTKTMEERIESEKGLLWLVERSGNRYHVLNNTNNRDEKQVTELLEKIEEMWAGNREPHFRVDMGQAQQIEAKKEAEQKMAKKIMQMTQRQSRMLKELFGGDERPRLTHLRMVLIGRKESGKSMAGNRILFEDVFGPNWMKKEFLDQTGISTAVKHHNDIGGLNITVVEAPGWDKNMIETGWLKSEVLHSVSMCAPGPHAFLLVVPISKAFTERDLTAVEELLEPFGETVWRHCLVLFTWGDWLKHRPIEEYIAGEGKALQQLVEKCRNEYHVLNCNFYIHQEVLDLFPKIYRMVAKNKGHYSTMEVSMTKMQKVARQALLTEEEWNRREQELIDHMLRAIALENEPVPPHVKMAASLDGVFVPSMSGDLPSEAGTTFWSQRAHAKVSEWLNTWARPSEVTSGVDSMSASVSCVENVDESSLPDDNQQQKRRIFPEKVQTTIDNATVSTNTGHTKRRYSC